MQFIRHQIILFKQIKHCQMLNKDILIQLFEFNSIINIVIVSKVISVVVLCIKLCVSVCSGGVWPPYEDVAEVAGHSDAPA